MPERLLFPEWRKENESTKYPFAMEAALTNGVQTLIEGTLIDACLYPAGGGPRLHISQVQVFHDRVVLIIGDLTGDLATGTFSLPNPEPTFQLIDASGRPAGIIISTSQQLALFSSWGIGTFEFTADQTEFAATCCIPMPQLGVRGLILEDGSIFTGQVWLIGDDGVVLSLEQITAPALACGNGERKLMAIRVDIVGDPLFRRRLCQPQSLFQTPQFIKTLTFKDAHQTVVVGPDALGDVKLTVNNDLARDTILRIHRTESGTKVEVVGSTFDSVQ